MKTSLLTLLVLIHLGSFATIHTVKQDSTGNYLMIQDAIDAAQTGDTVLIWPGTYYENIDFIGKSITVGSLMITTGDKSYKYNTIIDGNRNGSCVLIMNGEEQAVLFGLTLQHGSGFSFDNEPTNGGGIFVYGQSNAHVKNCLIKENSTTGGAGGIRCHGNSGLYMEGSSIFSNTTEGTGGGIRNGKNCNLVFDSVNRSSVYSNFSSLGCDISTVDFENHLYVYLDTCTVLEPDRYFILMADQSHNPVYNISFDIKYGLFEPFDGDLYVNPVTGDNNYSGTSTEDPLQSIAWAYSKIAVNEDHRNIIHLANGFYSDSVSNQIFPLNIRPNIDIVGESREGVIMDGEYKTIIAKGNRTISNYSFSNMTMQRAGWLDYESAFSRKWAAFIYIYRDAATVELRNMNFLNGWCSTKGGAVKINGGKNTKIIDCNFIGNFGDKGLELGHWSFADTTFISNCKFVDNDVDYNHPEYRFGGGMLNSGGVTIVTNSLFVNNNKQAFWALYDGENYLVNCTFVNNTLDHVAGSVWASESKLFIYNCINFNNGDYPLGVSNSEEMNRSRLEVYNSLLENGESSITINNEEWCDYYYDTTNIEGDPLFLGGNYNPYNLSENSPCIDAGTLELPEFIEIPEFDLAGNPRVTNGKIDMGAYEWNPTVGTSELFISQAGDSITISPNPASEYLHIYLKRRDKLLLKNASGLLMDLKGNIIREIDMNLSDMTYIMDVHDCQTGTYLFIYDNGGGLIKSRKVVVKR